MRDIEFPADLNILRDNINPMYRLEGGLAVRAGFRSTVDGELLEHFWNDLEIPSARLQGFFDETVFPHLRKIFQEELEEAEEDRQAAEAARRKALARAERLKEHETEKTVDDVAALAPVVSDDEETAVEKALKRSGRPRKSG